MRSLARYYELVDGVLGEFAALAARSGAVLMIASDHGFEWGAGRPSGLSSVAGATAAKWHRDEGMYLLAGPGIPSRPGHSGQGGVAQVAATLLSLVDLPAPSRAAPALADAGPAPSQAFPPTPHPRAPEPSSIRSENQVPQPGGVSGGAESGSAEKQDWEPAPIRRTPAPLTATNSRIASPATGDEEIRKLQALGYLGAGPEKNRGPRPHGTRTAASFSNEAQILEGLGRTAEALRCYDQALEQEPEDVAAKRNLSALLFEQEKDAARSDRLLVEAFLGGLPAGAELVVERAAAWRARGRIDRARALLDAAVAGAPENVPLRLFRGRNRVEEGDCQGAAADFSQAVRLEEGRAGSWAALATAQLCLGDRAAARRAFERAVALAPEREELRRALASLAEAHPRR